MIELSADQQALQALAQALGAQADGKRLRRELSKSLRQALEPAKQDVRAALMGMGTAGLETASPQLRTTVLKKLTVQTRLTGRSTGAKLRISKRGMPRGFENAPKRLNAKKGWRHPVPARQRKDGTWPEKQWVQQMGEPEYFDRTTRAGRARYRAAVLQVMNEHARHITRRV